MNKKTNATLSQRRFIDTGISKISVWVLILIGVVGNYAVQANTWHAPQMLNLFNNGNTVGFNTTNTDIAIDGKGHSIAIWVDPVNRQVISRSLDSSGKWAAEVVLDPTFGSSFPQVEISATGYATAIWYNASGLWTSDRSVEGHWTKPTLLMTVANFNPYNPQTKLTMNSTGDALLSWSNRGSVMTMRRSPGGTWETPVEIAATSLQYHDVAMKDIAINDKGDALIAWEFNSRHPHGYLLASELYVARQAKSETDWQQSGKIADTAVYANALERKLLLDAQGHAGIVYFPANSAGTDYKISRQIRQGKPWIKGQIVPTGCGFCKILNGIKIDGMGNITVMASRNYYLNPNKNGTISLTGSLTDPNWTTPVTIPTIHTVNQALTFDVGFRGDASAAWFASDPLTGMYLFKTASRSGENGMWKLGSSYKVNTGNYGQVELTVLDVKVNSSGQTVVLYTWGGYDASFALVESNLYAMVYN